MCHRTKHRSVERHGQLVKTLELSKEKGHTKLGLEVRAKDDRIAAREWISLFWHEAVVRDDGSGPRG